MIWRLLFRLIMGHAVADFALQDLLLSGVRLIPRESRFKPNSNT